MIFNIPEVGDIEFDPESIPSLDDADFYSRTVKECTANNFLVQTVNGHTVYICNYENGAGLEYYLTNFVLDLGCIWDIKLSYCGDDLDYYYWLVDEYDDPVCESIGYFHVMINAFMESKKLYSVNIGDDSKVYVLIDFPMFENNSVPSHIKEAVEKGCRDIYLEILSDFAESSLGDGEDIEDYGNFSSASDWGKDLICQYKKQVM